MPCYKLSAVCKNFYYFIIDQFISWSMQWWYKTSSHLNNDGCFVQEFYTVCGYDYIKQSQCDSANSPVHLIPKVQPADQFKKLKVYILEMINPNYETVFWVLGWVRLSYNHLFGFWQGLLKYFAGSASGLAVDNPWHHIKQLIILT